MLHCKAFIQTCERISLNYKIFLKILRISPRLCSAFQTLQVLTYGAQQQIYHDKKDQFRKNGRLHLIAIQNLFLVIVWILKIPLDGNFMVGYNSLRDACIYGRGGNSVDALNASVGAIMDFL